MSSTGTLRDAAAGHTCRLSSQKCRVLTCINVCIWLWTHKHIHREIIIQIQSYRQSSQLCCLQPVSSFILTVYSYGSKTVGITPTRAISRGKNKLNVWWKQNPGPDLILTKFTAIASRQSFPKLWIPQCQPGLSLDGFTIAVCALEHIIILYLPGSCQCPLRPLFGCFHISEGGNCGVILLNFEEFFNGSHKYAKSTKKNIFKV